MLRRVVAYSPGFSAARQLRGRLELFVTHSVADDVLPIDRTSRRVVAELKGQFYDVDYREFDGGHVVPLDMAAEAAEWLVR